MANNDTYVLKINLDQVNNINLQDSFNKIFGEDYNNCQNNEIIVMSKKEYNKYILENSGTIIECFNCDDDICIICHNQIKNSKVFKLNTCEHFFHYKCIKKWFSILSDKYTLLHHCPICRASNEQMIEL